MLVWYPQETRSYTYYRPSPVKLSPPPTPLKLSPLGGKVRGGQYHVRQKGGTISRTVGGWPFWCEEGRAKVVPATPLKLSPPALKLSVGAKYRFLGGGGGGGTISRGRVGSLTNCKHHKEQPRNMNIETALLHCMCKHVNKNL